MAERYDHQAIEKAAQAKWEAADLYRTDLTDTSRDPYYLLVEFPYPSGDLHIGHWYAFGVTDIYARYLRMTGKNILFPIGFDAFGLPAENAAIKNGVDPKEWTLKNIERMKGQLKSMGASFDWSKEVIACDPAYYKWTQWLFAKLFEHGLAERREAPVKWCPYDQTVLANEQVIDGRCERCGHEVEERVLTQWFLKITKYADRLLSGLDDLPWREEIKDAQRAWIGKSEGAKLSFKVVPAADAPSEEAAVVPSTSIDVFTTRPDTLYGVTYVVLAPEHALVAALADVVENAADVSAYVDATKRKTERERSEAKEKTGIRLEGIAAVNPASGEQVPVYVADYVLGSYGTGAVMAVPAHDERDFEFATRHGLPIKQVVIPQLIDTENPPQEGKEDTERDVIIGIVYDPAKRAYLCLKWKEQPWITFITGGVEGGEDSVDAARREIEEETGYTQLKFVRLLGGVSESRFYAAHKDLNRKAKSQAVYFELEGHDRRPVDAKEAAQHESVWLSAEEVLGAKLRHAEMPLIWHRLMSGIDSYGGDGVLVNSGGFSGRGNRDALKDITLAAGGEMTTQYRIRDWLVSRQRYWGCPIPIVYDPEGKPHIIPSEHLPWLLPTDVDFKPTGKAPLASSKELQERVTKIFGEGWTPEYDTLDTFVDSSWYFTRYLDPQDDHDFSDQALMKKWLPVNRYSGGSEHTTMHLLYARFFYKAMHDLALVPTDEPFMERFNRGLILGPDGAKMSKSKGNVINPDEIVRKFGADAVRIYLAFIGPYNEPGNYPWNLDGVASMRKFLDRVAALKDKVGDGEADEGTQRALARTAKKIGEDSDRFKFNTAISTLMVLVRDLEKLDAVPHGAYRDLVRMIAPFAPHLAEHLWSEEGSVHSAPWPTYDASLIETASADVIIQVNGKKRGDLALARDAGEAEAVAAATAIPAVAAALAGGSPAGSCTSPGVSLTSSFDVCKGI